MFEKPQDVSVTYVNHALNDALEVWLETGVLGLALMGLFAIWLVRRSVEIWRTSRPNGAGELDWSLARAATIVAGLLVAHSFLDYPLRTAAMMAIMAFACALLVEPLVRPEYGVGQALEAVSRRKSPRDTRLEPAASVRRSAARRSAEPLDVPSAPPDRLWGTNVKWPEEWSQSSKPHSADRDDQLPNLSKPRKD